MGPYAALKQSAEDGLLARSLAGHGGDPHGSGLTNSEEGLSELAHEAVGVGLGVGVGVNVTENEPMVPLGTLRPAAQHGAERITDEGEEKGARNAILIFGEERFGPPTESLKAQLGAVADLPGLNRMVRRAAKAASWQEMLDTP